MTDYTLGFPCNYGENSFWYDHRTNEIGIALDENGYKEAIKENKLIEFISDMLTHEHIHKYIYNEIGETVCFLFDAIGHLFCDFELLKKIYDEQGDMLCWKTVIEQQGFKAFTQKYGLSSYDLVRAGVKIK